MAKKKKATSKATHAKRQKAIERSQKEVAKASRNLELKVKRHKKTLSAMWYG